MSTAAALARWYFIHKWTSLACTLFLLLICVTGLPLIFHEEIDRWLEPHAYAALPADTPPASLDRLAAIGHQRYPGHIISSIFIDDDEPQIYVWMAPSFAAVTADPKSVHFLRFDARTAQLLETSAPPAAQHLGFIDLMLSLHTDLFADLPGELFLGLMGLLFVAALVSGVVLYGPFMKKLAFGTVREGRGSRLRWLDLHNLLGITALAWTLVVGTTGVMNELSTPLFTLWQRTDVKALLAARGGPAPSQNERPPQQDASAPRQNEPVPRQDEPAPQPQATLSSVQRAVDAARRAVPGMTVTSIVFPGNRFGTPYHYLVWTRGGSTLTSRLFSPVLVDARTGRLAAVVHMPWYLRALEMSRPLHFGDYGGLPLKILWALLDVITIAILGSGLYLWLARRERHAVRLVRIVRAHATVPALHSAASSTPSLMETQK